MRVTEIIQPLLVSLPQMHTWPVFLKRVILLLAIMACLGGYILLIAGLLGGMFLLLELVIE